MSEPRLAVVGPTHPDKGGVAAHTTTLPREPQHPAYAVVRLTLRRR